MRRILTLLSLACALTLTPPMATIPVHATMNNVIVPDLYSGDDSTVAFATTFKFFLEGDLLVRVYNTSTKVFDTDPVLNTDFTVSGGADGAGDPQTGTVTFTAAPATGKRVLVWRDRSFDQTTDYIQGGAFLANTHEHVLDKNVEMIQQSREKVDRAITVQAASTIRNLEIKGDLVAGKFLSWDGLAFDQVDSEITGIANPMTTADDILKGGALGVPSRLPKGANNTVLGVNSAGSFGYKTILGEDMGLVNIHGSLPPDLILTNNSATKNSKLDIDWTLGGMLLSNGSISHYIETGNLTVDITCSGAINCLDTGAEASSTWYNVFVIYNGTTVASLLSLSATAPTLPSGYSFKRRIGAIRNTGGSNFEKVFIHKNIAQYSDRNVQAVTSSASFVAEDMSARVPPTARFARVYVNYLGQDAGAGNVAELTVRATGNVTTSGMVILAVESLAGLDIQTTINVLIPVDTAGSADFKYSALLDTTNTTNLSVQGYIDQI